MMLESTKSPSIKRAEDFPKISLNLLRAPLFSYSLNLDLLRLLNLHFLLLEESAILTQAYELSFED